MSELREEPHLPKGDTLDYGKTPKERKVVSVSPSQSLTLFSHTFDSGSLLFSGGLQCPRRRGVEGSPQGGTVGERRVGGEEVVEWSPRVSLSDVSSLGTRGNPGPSATLPWVSL